MKAFVETTIVVDLLLKRKARRNAVRAGLSAYQETELPQYAIKEMKAGALSWFVWLHNKLVVTPSIPDVIDTIHRLSRTPRRNAAPTALEALAVTEESIAGSRYLTSSPSLSPSKREALRRKEMINLLRAHILLAWKKRRKAFTRVVEPLICFVEEEVILKDERIELGRTLCAHTPCCFGHQFSSRREDIKKLMKVCELGTREEDKRRYQALRHIARTPGRDLEDKMCRSLGDAVFALQSPLNSVIVTTNTKDVDPLASALGKPASRI